MTIHAFSEQAFCCSRSFLSTLWNHQRSAGPTWAN